MSIKIHLEFDSVDEAIVALGKMVGTPVRAANPAVTAGAPAVQAAPATTRKPRSDAGKPRGPHKQPNAAPQDQDRKAPATADSALTTSPAVAAPESAVAPAAAPTQAPTAPAVPAATVPTQEAVQAAVEKLYNAKGMEVTRDTLARFGVKRAKELPDDQRAAFIAKAEAVAAGKEQP